MSFYAIFCFLLPYFRIEGSQLWHLNERPKPFLLNDVIRDGELIVCRFLGKYRSPCVKTVDALLFQGLRTQVFEQKIKFGQTVGNGRSRKECCSQVLARPLLYGANGKEHIERTLRAVRIAQPDTLSWRVLNIKFLNWWLSSTKRWSMPIILKSTASSFRSAMLS